MTTTQPTTGSTTMTTRNEELYDFAARKRAEWNELGWGMVEATKKYNDEKARINAWFVELVAGGMDRDVAGDFIRESLARPKMVIDAEDDCSCDTIEELQAMWS